VLVLLGAILAGCATAPSEVGILSVAVAEPDGGARAIPVRLCRPTAPLPGGGAARLVVVNHGSPGEGVAARARYPLLSCDSEVARHFLARGMAVLAPLRRGYGGDDGTWAESYGPCESPDSAAAGRETGRDIRAAIAAARALPGIAPEGIAVIGQSAGGWGVLGLAADPPPGVSAFVAVAPGRGGRREGRANENCRPDRLVADAGRLAEGGTAAAKPVLVLHTPNDGFFDPPLLRAVLAAYAAAGGRPERRELPAWGRDGHAMFYGRNGSAAWGPAVDGWIDAHP